MRIEYMHTGCDQATVTLSKRNLLAMLHKLEMPGSARTLVSGCGQLILQCETDEEHYADRPEGPPGTMHFHTETFIQAEERKLQEQAQQWKDQKIRKAHEDKWA